MTIRQRRPRARIGGPLLGAMLTASVLAGCSQVAAIAPVGGDHLAETRYAAIDVLLDAGIEVLTAPVCEQAEDGAISCAGETVDGEDIGVASSADDPASVTVTVGSDELYSGSILDVLDKAARGES